MFKKLFLGLLIACSCNIGNTMEEGIFSQDTDMFFNSAKKVINSCNAVDKPLSSDANKALFDKYNNEKYTFHGGLFVPKSCDTLYDVLLSFAIDMRVRSILKNNNAFIDGNTTEIVDFSGININDHIKQVVSDLCDMTEYGKTHNIYFDNNKLMIKKK